MALTALAGQPQPWCGRGDLVHPWDLRLLCQAGRAVAGTLDGRPRRRHLEPHGGGVAVPRAERPGHSGPSPVSGESGRSRGHRPAATRGGAQGRGPAPPVVDPHGAGLAGDGRGGACHLWALRGLPDTKPAQLVTVSVAVLVGAAVFLAVQAAWRAPELGWLRAVSRAGLGR